MNNRRKTELMPEKNRRQTLRFTSAIANEQEQYPKLNIFDSGVMLVNLERKLMK